MREIPEYRLRVEPVSPETDAVLGFEPASDEIGDRHHLGRRPTWLQDDQTPSCLDCGDRMTFCGQLDSIGDDITSPIPGGDRDAHGGPALGAARSRARASGCRGRPTSSDAISSSAADQCATPHQDLVRRAASTSAQACLHGRR